VTFSPPSAILPALTNNSSSTVLEREFPTKRRHLDEGWTDYTATDGQSVDLPPSLIYMLNDNKFVSQSRSKFLQRSSKRVLSGPMDVGKSYLALFLAVKAFAENWPVFYIADACVLNIPSLSLGQQRYSYSSQNW